MASRCAALVLWAIVWLFAPASALAQSFSYSQDCISNVDNKTVVVPSSVDQKLGNGAQIEVGDTLAVYTDDGVCAGYDVWTGDGSDFAFPAAGPNPAADTANGFSNGELLKFEVYDVSARQSVDLGSNVAYKSCRSVDLSTCVDDGTYSNGALTVMLGFTEDALPVEFASFEVARSGSRAQLSWSTASETNNTGFNVQHKPVDATSWSTLAFVEGHGTTDEPQTYQFETEDLPFGEHSFRLQQVDTDGSTAFSSVVRVEVALDQAYQLSEVYPNPARSSAVVDLVVKESQTVTVEVYDLLGRRVETVFDNQLSSNQSRSVRVNAERLSSGAYFIRVQGESFAATRRLMVLK